MDKTSNALIKKMISGGKGTDYICAFDSAWLSCADTDIDSLALEIGARTEDVRAAVRFLTDAGYMEYQTANGNLKIGFHLSHKGLNWRYFRKREIMDYIADKWPEFIALIISLVSLVTSIAAIAKPSS